MRNATFYIIYTFFGLMIFVGPLIFFRWAYIKKKKNINKKLLLIASLVITAIGVIFSIYQHIVIVTY